MNGGSPILGRLASCLVGSEASSTANAQIAGFAMRRVVYQFKPAPCGSTARSSSGG